MGLIEKTISDLRNGGYDVIEFQSLYPGSRYFRVEFKHYHAFLAARLGVWTSNQPWVLRVIKELQDGYFLGRPAVHSAVGSDPGR